MTDNGGPWSREPEPPAPKRRPPKQPKGRLIAWLAVMATIVGGLLLLSRVFPGQMDTGEDRMRAAQGVGMLVLLSTALLNPGRINWTEKGRHIALWAGIVLIFVLGFAYRDVFADAWHRVRVEFGSSYPTATGPRELVVAQGEGGGYYLTGQVNGQPVRFLVDTGATDTVLSPADAKRLRLDAGLKFERMSETANGVGYSAAFTADSLSVGPITLSNVEMAVNQAPMSNSLLGMSFLSRLESFQVRGNKLYLKARE